MAAAPLVLVASPVDLLRLLVDDLVSLLVLSRLSVVVSRVSTVLVSVVVLSNRLVLV